MYCAKCGAEQVPNAAFCHRCGQVVGAESVPAKPQPQLVRLTWIFWLLVFCAASAWLGFLLPLIAGRELKGVQTLAVVVWSAGPFAYYWNKRSGKGWIGFGIGALCAVAALIVVNFSFSYVRLLDANRTSEAAPKQ
jgi:hypothetical protein